MKGKPSYVRVAILLRRVLLRDFLRWAQRDGQNPAVRAGEIIEAEVAGFRLEKVVASNRAEVRSGEGPKRELLGKRKLSGEQIQRLLFLSATMNHMELARRFHISPSSVRRILQARAQSEIHVPLPRNPGGRKPSPASREFVL